jgi:hypothetical protein
MSNRVLLLELTLMLCLVIIPACKAETSSNESADQIDVPTSINLVAAADLGQTTQIDLIRREDQNETSTSRLELLFVFTDEDTIHSLVSSLDTDLDLSLRAGCPSHYLLVFHLADGRWYEFDYACELASPSYLRGGQEFWHGLDIIVPDSFNRLISGYIIEAATREKLYED